MTEKEYIPTNPETLEVYSLFKSKEGSEHIAKPITLDKLISLCKEHRPKRILELGAGIGTISYALLKYSDAYVDMYEHNDYCLELLSKNLTEFKGRYSVEKNYRTLPASREYDLIVVDGGGGKQGDAAFPKMVWFYIQFLESVKHIFIEGNRTLQKIHIRKALKDRFVYSIVRYPHIYFHGERMPGGTHIICKRRASIIPRLLNYAYWEMREQKAIFYAVRYRVKKIKNLISNRHVRN